MPNHKSERQYLLDEAEQAKAAAQQTVEELKRTLQAAASPTALTQQHPWAALGVAAAAGFGLGTAARGMTRKTPEVSMEELLARLREEQVDGKLPPASRNPQGRGVFSSLASVLQTAFGGLLKMALRNALTAAVSARAAAAASEEPAPSPAGATTGQTSGGD